MGEGTFLVDIDLVKQQLRVSAECRTPKQLDASRSKHGVVVNEFDCFVGIGV